MSEDKDWLERQFENARKNLDALPESLKQEVGRYYTTANSPFTAEGMETREAREKAHIHTRQHHRED